MKGFRYPSAFRPAESRTALTLAKTADATGQAAEVPPTPDAAPPAMTQ